MQWGKLHTTVSVALILAIVGVVSVSLRAALSELGYRRHELPMSEFIKAGGASKCLALFLPQRP